MTKSEKMRELIGNMIRLNREKEKTLKKMLQLIILRELVPQIPKEAPMSSRVVGDPRHDPRNAMLIIEWTTAAGQEKTVEMPMLGTPPDVWGEHAREEYRKSIHSRNAVTKAKQGQKRRENEE